MCALSRRAAKHLRNVYVYVQEWVGEFGAYRGKKDRRQKKRTSTFLVGEEQQEAAVWLQGPSALHAEARILMEQQPMICLLGQW